MMGGSGNGTGMMGGYGAAGGTSTAPVDDDERVPRCRLTRWRSVA